MPGLGRRYAPDYRDRQSPIRALLAADPAPIPNYKYWRGNMLLDQGNTSQCVEYAWHHWVQLGTIRPKRKYPYWTLGDPYHQMQRVDEWEGEGYDGTSVRAGAKVLTSMGYIASYLWAWDLRTVIEAVSTLGPVVVGTNWYDNMFFPDSTTGIVNVSGSLAGGHAWVIDGANNKKGIVRAKNSWGHSWGKRGRFWMAYEDLERLILEDGEACLAVELAVD